MNNSVKSSFYHTMRFVEKDFYMYVNNAGLDVVDFEYYDPDVLYVYYSDCFSGNKKVEFDNTVKDGLKVISSHLPNLLKVDDIEELGNYFDANGWTDWFNGNVLDDFYSGVESSISSFANDCLSNAFKYIEDGISNCASSGEMNSEDGFVGYSDVESVVDNIAVVVESESNLFWDGYSLALVYLKVFSDR